MILVIHDSYVHDFSDNMMMILVKHDHDFIDTWS